MWISAYPECDSEIQTLC